MKRKLLYTLMFGTVVVLTACGGGGGGGGGDSGSVPIYNTPNPYLRTEVPFSTPTRAATVTPLVGVTSDASISETYAANIENNREQNIIIAGRETQPSTIATWNDSRISMLGWEGGRLVDKTAQWFPNQSNIILGTDPTVQFADFFRSGRNDMFVTSSTDMAHYGPAHVFENTGTHFNRIDIPLPGWVGTGGNFTYSATTNRVWGHGATVVDLNNDGYKDFLVADYGPNLTVGINRMGEATPVKNFKTYVASDPYNGLSAGGSSVAVADFLGNGQKQIVVTDTWCGTANCTTNPTKMFSYNINSNDQLSFNYLSTLPTPRFELPKWAGYNFGGSHNVLALTFNMATGLPSSGNDLLIFSRPSVGPERYSEIQFLKNNGTGTFTDITDTTLFGYNTQTHTTYNPKFIDINNDGLTDILVSNADYSGLGNSNQFLLRSADGKYVAAHQNLLTDFVNQVSQISGANNNNNVNVVKDADGKLYLVSLTNYVENGIRQQGIYLSAIGNGNATIITPQTAINLIKQTWPYMTDVQANRALAMTSTSYMTSAGTGSIIDLNAAMNPVGSLGLPNSSRPISGFLSGINIDNHNAVATDSLGRGYNINLKSLTGSSLNAFQYNTQSIDTHELTSHAEYLVGGNAVTTNGLRIGAENRSNMDATSFGTNINSTSKPAQYTVGIPELYKNGNLRYGMQYTSLNSNPLLSMSGSWGTVNNAGVLDNVVSYRSGGFSATGSLMNISTNMQPGLVTNISNITGYWGEAGYRHTDMGKGGIGDLGFYVGVKPVVLSGSAQVNMPTGIDNNGNTMYSRKNYNIGGDVTPYIRSMYVYPIEKNTLYRLSGMAMANGQYRIMNEIRWFLP